MLSSRKHKYFGILVILTDACMILAAFATAFWIRFSNVFISFQFDLPPVGAYIQAVALVVLPLHLFVFRAYQLYQPGRHIRRIYELLNVAKAVTISIVITMALTFIYRDFSYSRATLLFAWMCSIVFSCVGRYGLIQIEYHIRKNKDRNRILVIGDTQSAADLVAWSKSNLHYGQDVVGLLSTHEVSGGVGAGSAPVLGTVIDINQILTEKQIDEVVIADPAIARETVTDIMLRCESNMVTFKVVADFYGLMSHFVDVEYVSNVPLIGFKAPPLDDPWNRAAKRFFDVVVSALALVMLSPVLTILAIWVKLSSGGPVLYKQERLGRDGQTFGLYKFRTMRVGAEAETGPTWARENDTRVTSIGPILRRLNLDELPQFWNVLVGHMSLVGPRPERPHFVEQFKDQIPRYMTRHKIKSGLTGWAQIHGLRGNTSLEERIKYDLYYMENWTLMLDIEILFATLFAYKNAY